MSDWQKNKEARRTAYGEKLKDPRWQKLRLQVFERDEWACQWCYAKKRTLAVHHLWYEKGAEPWEAGMDSLLTVCELCHQQEYEYRNQYESELLEVLRRKGFSAVGILQFVRSFSAVAVPDLFEFRAAGIALSIGDFEFTEKQLVSVRGLVQQDQDKEAATE